MSEDHTPSSRFSVGLSGKMFQFNITILVLVILILGVLFISTQSTNPILNYAGTIIALVAVLVLVGFVIFYYFKQKPRPLDGQPVAVTIKNKDGDEISLKNPPDCVFQAEELRTIARSFLVGYDNNLCADGQVIGKASEGNYRLYSEAEKKQFAARHQEEIKGKRAQAAELLKQTEVPETQSPNVQPSDPNT